MIAEYAAEFRSIEWRVTRLVRQAVRGALTFEPLNAFFSVGSAAAHRMAEDLESELARGQDRGLLHGIPIGVKDIINVDGYHTQGASTLFNDVRVKKDSDCVKLLRDAGAVIVGKTQLHELAYGITSENRFGQVRNPVDPERIPGGSSGGSAAAVVAGMVPMALGTDTGGSIRIPASFCGCAGLKPTFGLVSKRGVLPLGFSLDHVGPLAVNVDDLAITLNALVPQRTDDYRPGTVTDLKGVRVGRPTDFYFDRLAPGVAKRVEEAFQNAAELGATIVDVPTPDVEKWNAAARVILLAEAAAAIEPYLDQKRHWVGEGVLALLDQGRLVPATMYIQAQRLRSKYIRRALRIWEHADCLFTPTTPTTAPKIGETTVNVGGVVEDVRLATTRLVRGINLLGWPAISIPCGNDELGLPVGLQIIAPPFAEKNLLRIGAAMETAHPTKIFKQKTDWDDY